MPSGMEGGGGPAGGHGLMPSGMGGGGGPAGGHGLMPSGMGGGGGPAGGHGLMPSGTGGGLQEDCTCNMCNIGGCGEGGAWLAYWQACVCCLTCRSGKPSAVSCSAWTK